MSLYFNVKQGVLKVCGPDFPRIRPQVAERNRSFIGITSGL